MPVKSFASSDPTLVRRIAVLGILVLSTALTRPGACQTYAQYGYFEGLSAADLGRVQVKLTYLGLQNLPVATVAFAVSNNPAHLSLFVPFRRPGFSYNNDRFARKSFSVTSQDLKAMIESVGTLPNVTSGSADAKGFVSFALLDTLGDTQKVFESIPDAAATRGLFGALLTVFQANGDAFRTLREFGCAIDALPNNSPTAVDGLVSVRFSGVRADRSAKGQYVGRVRVKNTSTGALAAPLLLVVKISGNATLLGASAATCQTDFSGQPFVILSSTSGLAPGATTERVLCFSNPSLEKFNVSFHVYSGPGTP
jgi:hypothetical protein